MGASTCGILMVWAFWELLILHEVVGRDSQQWNRRLEERRLRHTACFRWLRPPLEEESRILQEVSREEGLVEVGARLRCSRGIERRNAASRWR